MSNPPNVQEGGCGTVVADGGSERERSSEDDNQQDATGEADFEAAFLEDSSRPAGRALGAPRGVEVSGVGA